MCERLCALALQARAFRCCVPMVFWDAIRWFSQTRFTLNARAKDVRPENALR